VVITDSLIDSSERFTGHPEINGSRYWLFIPVAFPMKLCHSSVGNPVEKRSVLNHMKQKKDVQQGTLALMVLKTLDVLGPLHGYAVARRIEQISGDLLSVNQGTLYPVLLRLEQEGAITSDWAISENNRRARFYRLTRMGHKLLESEKRDWEETGAIIARFFEVKAEDLA
jgi:transcriptional regulator